MDWIPFLQNHAIEYVTSGPNVSRGEIALRCPLCFDDPSHHLALSLTGRGWICRRNREHRGRSNARLVQVLLRCSPERAREITGDGLAVPSDFEAYTQRVLQGEQPKPEPSSLSLPAEFKPLITSKVSARPFVRYLMDRGYSRSQLDLMHKEYDLHYATHGAFAGRIIFPVYYRRRLVSWTGRTISPIRNPRYKARTSDDADPISHFLLWYDDIMQSTRDVLCLCEGPFDALRVRMIGDAEATCLFTSTATTPQLYLLQRLIPRFRKRYLLLDEGTQSTAIKLQALLKPLQIEIRSLPPGVKDPAEANRRQLLDALGIANRLKVT